MKEGILRWLTLTFFGRKDGKAHPNCGCKTRVSTSSFPSASFLSLFMFVSYIHASHDTPTADTHALSLSLSLAQAHTESPTLKHTCSLSHSSLSSLTAKEGGGGGGEVSLGGLKYKEEKRRAAAFLLAPSGCLCERQGSQQVMPLALRSGA